MTQDEIIEMWIQSNQDVYVFARLVAQHAKAEEREACLNCYSPDDTATDWADKIQARGQA